MGRPRKAPTVQARIARFADDELTILVDKLLQDVDFKASPVDVLGALVIAGRGLPLPIVRELVTLYIKRERAEAAKLGGIVETSGNAETGSEGLSS
jgi:hypothetical protein